MSDKHLTASQQEQVLKCLPLATGLVRPFERMFPDMADDLRQEAYLALVESVHRYDPTKGVPIGAWVTYRIKGARSSYLGESDELTKTERKRLREVRSWETEVEQQLGHPPSRFHVARVILRASSVPQWILGEVRQRRNKRWKRLEEDLKRSMGTDPQEELIAAAFGLTSQDQFLDGAPTEPEVAEVIEATHEIGNREVLSAEDVPGYEPTTTVKTGATVRLRQDVQQVDECFRQLPPREQLALRFVLARIPMAIGQRALGVAQATAYRIASNGMSRLITLLTQGQATGGKQDGNKRNTG